MAIGCGSACCRAGGAGSGSGDVGTVGDPAAGDAGARGPDDSLRTLLDAGEADSALVGFPADACGTGGFRLVASARCGAFFTIGRLFFAAGGAIFAVGLARSATFAAFATTCATGFFFVALVAALFFPAGTRSGFLGAAFTPTFRGTLAAFAGLVALTAFLPALRTAFFAISAPSIARVDCPPVCAHKVYFVRYVYLFHYAVISVTAG